MSNFLGHLLKFNLEVQKGDKTITLGDKVYFSPDTHQSDWVEGKVIYVEDCSHKSNVNK